MVEIAKFGIAVCILGPLLGIMLLRYSEGGKRNVQKIVRRAIYLDTDDPSDARSSVRLVFVRWIYVILVSLIFIGLCEAYLAYSEPIVH